ncbi:hypothetical protein [Stigmatella erecta]|uniref:Tetratricopeptide repeat-containing protein n=1 Tax=Stigmatella erecta TaxID=83460 RepID=A0A1I0KBI5_9BACT|nr:hypothetical protein [Stigmatella erecta]SEU21605.1 hypothetical protein SAMN05443639_11027 [Stigmatella erecta]
MPQTGLSGSRSLRSALTLAVLVGVSPASHAAANPEVQRYLISIRRLYENLEYERALNQIQLAQQQKARSTEDEVTLSLYEGILLTEMGRVEPGTAAFKAALLLKPEAQLPVPVAPKIGKLFESVRQQVKREMAPLLAQQQAEPPARSPSLAPPVPAPAAPGSGAEGVSQRAPGRDLRKYALVPAAVGGGLLVAGGVSWAISRGERGRLRDDDPALATREDVDRSVSRGRTWQTVGFSLLGVGAAGVATAAGMYFLGGPAQSMSLGVSTDGTSAMVHGRWP